MTENGRVPLVLGAMMFGTRVDEETAFAILDRFVERGGQWIDTADCYAFWADEDERGGASERVLGRWLAGRPGVREQIKIATKTGAERLPGKPWPRFREGLSARAVREAFAGSLERLGLERVDLLWLHMEDRSVAIEETVDALAECAADRFGASNHPAWRVERARVHAAACGVRPIDALQLNATYLRPRPGTLPPGADHRFGVLSDEQRDYAAANGLEIWAYTPLLTGAYDNPEKQIADVYAHPGNAARLEALDSVAKETGASRGQVVLAWLVQQGITPMLGGSKVHQLDSALDAVDLKLTDDQASRLSSVDQPDPAPAYAEQ